MQNRSAYTYILTNKRNTVLYTGVTSDLVKRVYEHKQKLVEGFTKKYNIDKLVYYDMLEDIENAIIREKQIKGWIRKKKIELIDSVNPDWKDLYDNLV
ncbi:MAG: GIY-YIG nuclease family protein [Candidatus Omnitrophota bacterium]